MWPPMEILKVQAQLLPTVLTESIYYVVILIRKKKKKRQVQFPARSSTPFMYLLAEK